MKKWEIYNLRNEQSVGEIGVLNNGKVVEIPEFKNIAYIGESQAGTQLCIDYLIAYYIKKGETVNIVELEKPYRYNNELINGEYLNEIPNNTLKGITLFTKVPVNRVAGEKLKNILGNKNIIHYNYSGKNPCLEEIEELIDTKIHIKPSLDVAKRIGNYPNSMMHCDNGVIGIVETKGTSYIMGLYTFGNYGEAYSKFMQFMEN